MMIKVRTEGVRLLLLFPRFLMPLGLYAAARFGDEDMDDGQKALLLSLATAARKTHWRRYRGLELVRVSTLDGTEVVIKL